jgi:hypothetical protein
MLERGRGHWKVKARELEADRDRLAAELEHGAADVAKGADAGVRAVQGWMAADVATALGHADVYTAAEHGGHKSWADWWANLMGEVRSRRGRTLGEPPQPLVINLDLADDELRNLIRRAVRG